MRTLIAICGVLVLLNVIFAQAPAPQKPASPPPMSIRLVDVARQAGINVLNISGSIEKNYLLEVVGNGAAWFDYDNDGLIDLLIVNGSGLEHLRNGGDPMATLYRNNGDGTFSDVTAPSKLLQKGWGMGVCVADYDNNGFQDVYLTAYGPNVLFHNNENGTFTDVTKRAGVGDAHWSAGCAFGDYDRDGFVDLYVANYVDFDPQNTPTPGSSSYCQYMGIDVLCGPRGLRGAPDVLYHNNGNGTFTNVARAAGIHDPDYYGLGVIFSDLDNDGWPDIYVANDSTPNFLFHNNRNGTFSEMALEAGVALSEEGRAQAGMGVDTGDYNHDGFLDLFVTNFSQDSNTLYQNNGDGTFRDVTFPAGLGAPSLPYLAWGTGFVDLDNDGLLDLFVANGHIYPTIDHYPLGSKFLERKQLFQNLGDGRFRDVTDDVGGGLLLERSSRGVAFGDYDNDGDLDMLVVNLNDRPTLLRNDGGNKQHWISLRLVGTKSNRDAIGARLRIETGGRKQIAEVRSGGSYVSHNDIRVRFGLGQETRIQRLEVRWPSGLAQAFVDLPVNQSLLLTEGQAPAPLRAPRVKPK